MPNARIRRLAMLSNFLRAMSCLDAERDAMAEDYPDFKSAPADLDAALAQAEFARAPLAKAIAMLESPGAV